MNFRNPVTGEVPSNLQRRVSYVSGTNRPQYIGYALRGTAEGASDWTIQFIEYTGANEVKRTVALQASWTGRTSASYA